MKIVNESIYNFINEEEDPLDGICSIDINNKTYKFHIGKLNKYMQENYKVENLPVSKLSKKSYWKDFINPKRKKNDWAIFKINGRWKSHDQISDEEFEKFRQEELAAIKRASLKYPIIVVINNRGNVTEILDGNHRVTKASMLGKDTIKAYILPEGDILEMSPILLKSLK